MTTKEILFDGQPPWGFRMNGGADAGHPLRISRVNPGSKAESKAVREGDLITSINGQSTKCLSNADSHALLRTVKENLRLGLNEDPNNSPRRKSKEIKSSPVTFDKNELATPANKENDKPSRSKLRRRRKQRLKALLQEKLLGYKETPGHVLTNRPVSEEIEAEVVQTNDVANGDDDDTSSRKLYDNLPPDNEETNEREIVAVVENYPKNDDSHVEYFETSEIINFGTREPSEVEGSVDVILGRNPPRSRPDVIVELVEEANSNVASCVLAEVISSASDVEENTYDLESGEIRHVTIQPVEQTNVQDTNDEVRICTEIPLYFLPPKRYLDVISEENSDLSDVDRPWENSDRIRQINAVDAIPEDWFGSHDGIDTSWQDGKSLEEMSDILVITDSLSDSDTLFDDKKPQNRRNVSQTPPSVVNIVSCFYAKEKLRPIQIETVENRGLLQGPNSEVVEIVYLDSSDSEAISSCKSETNLATTPVQEVMCDTEAPTVNEKGISISQMTQIQKQSSFNSEPNSETSPKSVSPNAEIFVWKRELSDEEKISEMISDITQSAQDIISSSSEQLSCTSPASFSHRRFGTPRVDSMERCRSVPISGDEAAICRSSRSVCSDLGADSEMSHFTCFLHDSLSDDSSQSTTRPMTATVATLRELSMSAVLRLPFGISFLKQLGFDQSEYDSYSGYMPEDSEYSFSSKHPFSEGEYVVADETEDEESVTCGLPPISLPDALNQTEEKWVGIQIPSDTKLLLAVTPTSSKPVKISSPNVVDLLDLHQKFVERRGYHESEDKFPATKYDQLVKKDEVNDDDFSEFHALQEYHALRQMKMKRQVETNDDKNRINGTEGSKGEKVVQKRNNALDGESKEMSAVECNDESEVVGNSRLLELIQSEEFKGSSGPVNMNSASYPYWLLLNRQTSTEDDVQPEGMEKPAYNQLQTAQFTSIIEESAKKTANSKSDRSSEIRRKDELQKARPKSVPPSGEKFRQLMYEEYMNKLAELSERRRLKALKLSEPNKCVSTPSIAEIDQLKGEFMGKVKERMFKLGLTDDFVVVDSSLLQNISTNDDESARTEKKLPRHVQELMDLADEFDIIGKEGLLIEIDEALSPERKGFLTGKGVWSPVQSPENEKQTLDLRDKRPSREERKPSEEDQTNEEPSPAVWTPRSAGPSPTLGRKFRPVNFQSPPPQRKNYPLAKDQEPVLPKALPPEPASSTTDTCGSLSSSSRLTSSTSENSTLTSSQLRLPSSQNPTITLLQKAREGHIPKGAQYLEDTAPDRTSGLSPDEIVYSVKKEYTTADEGGVKKVVELTPKKFVGIGPTTREGVPIGLKSEVTENNQQRWYKRMYDSLHKTADRDKDFVTVTYKTRRKGQYPYSSFGVGGYASEPERLGYDSDASISKYATLDRRKIRNKENDFTTSTLPRNRYAPAVKHAVNVYKNQPGRIEDYEPGNSSIADIEKKQWWDEVLDIFDGELSNSSKDVYAAPHRQSFTTYALKDTGYDSDSTLVFKRRENMNDNLSPAEQRMAYKVVQRGGEVPLHGLRKAIPDRPKDDSEIEYFPLSPTLTRIRVHKKSSKPKETFFYPVTTGQPLFGAFKRTAARSAAVPSPPKRHSSRNNSTLRLYGTISSTKSPDSSLSPTGYKEPVVKEILCNKSSGKKGDQTKYGIVRKKDALRKSPELKAPGEVKKVMKDSSKGGGTVVKSSTTLYSSTSKKPVDDKSLKVTVAISSKGKGFLTSSSSASSKSDVRKISPSLSPPAATKKPATSKKMMSSSLTSLTKSVSRPTSGGSTISIVPSAEPIKKSKKDIVDVKKKKDKKPEVILKNPDKSKEEDKKKSKKKAEILKKKNNGKKKEKENVPIDEPQHAFKRDERPSQLHVKTDNFFQHLLLKDRNSGEKTTIQTQSTIVKRMPSVSERAKIFDHSHQGFHKSEPSLRNLNVYLANRKPVSESRFRSLDRGERRALSPFYGTLDFYEKLDKFDRHNNVWDSSLSYRGQTPTYESIKGRSSSEPPTSPSPTQDTVDTNVASPSLSRSPSCRRIRRSTSKTIESVAGVKKKVRSKSLNETDRQSQVGSLSSLSMSYATDHTDYHSYVFELLHSQPKSERFKELHNFYSSLERMAELEKTTSNTDLRPRMKGEEVIDFDRWKQLRNKEKAEQELNLLYNKLIDDQREKDLLFLPKETVRWQGDRGLRNKEKSVEDLRHKFQKMAESSDSDSKFDIAIKDVYKPLWRGNSVVNLAQSLTSVVGSKRGRPVCETNEDKYEVTKIPPPKPSKEMGNRLWSSLSMEQVNALKCQLSEIYNTVSNLKHERIQKIKQNIEDYEMNVAETSEQDSALTVRSNSLVGVDQLYSPAVKRKHMKKREILKSDSISSIPSWKMPKPLSEPEKKKLSMSLCAEVKERIKKKKHGTLVIPRETLGAVAAIKGNKKLKSPCQSNASPRTCYSLLSDDSSDKRSGINKENRDFLLVLTPKEQQREVKKNMDDWGGKQYSKVLHNTSSSSSSASTVIHLGSRDDFHASHSKIDDLTLNYFDSKMETNLSSTAPSPTRSLYSSQSCADLKELFGETHATTYSTPPLKQNPKPFHSSVDSICKSTSPDPHKYYQAYLKVVKAGDVRKLKEKFESYDDIYNLRRESPVQKRFQSDPDLARDFLSRKGGELSKVVIKGQELGDVQWLRRKYESRKVSPVPFKIEDRYMPHINVISKTASLQQRSLTPPSKNEMSRTGNVERLKQQFEHQRAMSLLGEMYTSTPEITELRDIAPYLECDWIAHKNPHSPKPLRKPLRKRPASTSPVRQSILKNADIFANQPFNPEIHRPLFRYQPEPPESERSWYHKPWNVRPTVTFKEPIGNPIPTPPRDHASRLLRQESPHRYVESEVNIHYKSPVRSEAKAAWPEDELAEKQAEIMRRIYQEQRRTKYLNELHDMYSRRHTDNLLPSQKSPIPLNRYDDFPLEPHPPRPRDRTPEPKLVARALYNFVGQSSRELSFRRGDIIYVRRQIDKNWYEGEHNAMIGLFPFNYVEIIPYDGIRTLPKKANEGQARAKFNFQAQTHLELSLVKGELVLLTRRVDENWFEGRIGSRKGIFPVSYVEVLVEPGERIVSPSGQISTKPVVAPASHSVMLNGAKDIGQQHYQPPRPALYSSSSLPPQSKASDISLVSQSLHIDTQSDPVPYRVLYNYKPQNDDELELKEGDVVYVMEKCDDGWYVGSLHRNGQFGTFPGNYVELILQ